MTDENGDVIENTSYAPYGEIISGGTETRFNYEGKEYDSVVGDTDFNFRKYDQDLGIFTQPDTVIQNVYDPQTLNRYSFERNNPYKYTDPSGHLMPKTLAVGVGSTLVIVGAFIFGGLTFGVGAFVVLGGVAIAGTTIGLTADNNPNMDSEVAEAIIPGTESVTITQALTEIDDDEGQENTENKENKNSDSGIGINPSLKWQMEANLQVSGYSVTGQNQQSSIPRKAGGSSSSRYTRVLVGEKTTINTYYVDGRVVNEKRTTRTYKRVKI